MSTTPCRFGFSLALLAVFATPASASEFTNADLAGRKAFRTPAGGGRWTVTEPRFGWGAPWGRENLSLEMRGALTFDGEGGLTGFRLVWGMTHASPMTFTGTEELEDHRATPLRQGLVGTCSVTPDGVVEMNYIVSPVHVFGSSFTFIRQVGTSLADATETASAILSDGERLDGLISQSLHHTYPDEFPDSPEVSVTYAHAFETFDGCPPAVPAPRFQIGPQELAPPR